MNEQQKQIRCQQVTSHAAHQNFQERQQASMYFQRLQLFVLESSGDPIPLSSWPQRAQREGESLPSPKS